MKVRAKATLGQSPLPNVACTRGVVSAPRALARCGVEIGQSGDRPAACKIAGGEPGREHLAVPARQLALEPFFTSYEDIVDHCCFAWNKLIDQPWKIMSIGMRDWAYGF